MKQHNSYDQTLVRAIDRPVDRSRRRRCRARAPGEQRPELSRGATVANGNQCGRQAPSASSA